MYAKFLDHKMLFKMNSRLWSKMVDGNRVKLHLRKEINIIMRGTSTVSLSHTAPTAY